MTDEHRPVLVSETLHYLAVVPEGIYLDCTFGRGGHSRAILQRLGPGGRLFALDRDPEGVEAGRQLAAEDPRLRMYAGAFADLQCFAEQHDLRGRVDGMVFDLGVSTPQLMEAARGFSFSRDGPLDMRMDPGDGMSAAQWLAAVSVPDLSRVLRRYGEEPHAGRIARAIVKARDQGTLETTGQLADIVHSAYPAGARARLDPATRTFQAIRMHVNQELPQLQQALAAFLDVLSPGGRAVFISFHSLEDRLIKRFLRSAARDPRYPDDLPVRNEQLAPRLKIVASNVRPGPAELAANPRARSAVLRAAEKLC